MVNVRSFLIMIWLENLILVCNKKEGKTMSKSKVVFFKDLKPSWGAKGAKEVGFMRWFAHYCSGKPPVSHTNPETGAISEYCKVGVWSLSVGQRQLKHSHIGEEIYVVIRGQIAVENGDGSETVLGPLDCLYNPPKG